MKRSLLALSLAAVVGVSAAYAAGSSDYSPLAGNWQGTVTTNLKNPSGGGNPTQGETGTPVTIAFNPTTSGLTGSSTVGTNPSEQWTISGDNYIWTDGEITVTTMRVKGFEEIPTWVREQAKLTSGDSYFAFKYMSCTVNKDKSPCKLGTHLPNGIDKSGMWLFTVKADKMSSNVYYTYDNDANRKRILEQSLMKKK